jgi:TonB family protein
VVKRAIAPVAQTPAPTPQATSLPTPVAIASSASACVRSNADPGIVATPGPPDIPPAVRAQKVSGTAAIAVSLDARGRVTATSISQSSGNPGLDAIAAQMARDATYSPRYAACKAVAGTFTFTVKFAAW